MNFPKELLENQVACVTGASRGIGQGIAFALGKAGATVIGTATTQKGADHISALFKAEKIKGLGLVLNVNDQASIDPLIQSVKQEWGAISILVNNAGITQDNLFLRMKEEEWSSVLETNLTSVYRMSKACLRDMLKAHFGRIINISSVTGTTGSAGQANYAAAKAGVIGFTKSLALEVGSRQITVNAVSPGFIQTDMTDKLTATQRESILQRIPMQRSGTVEEIASAVVFLASPWGSYMTGQTLHINGGMYLG